LAAAVHMALVADGTENDALAQQWVYTLELGGNF
jgi:hypothetical protein